MKTVNNTKSAQRRHFPSLALLLAAVTLLAFAPQSARAAGEKPFHANFITQFETLLEFPLLHFTVSAQGQATYMGKTTAFSDDQVVNLAYGKETATYTLTAANGDTLVLALQCSGRGHNQRRGGNHFLRHLCNYRRHRPIHRRHRQWRFWGIGSLSY